MNVSFSWKSESLKLKSDKRLCSHSLFPVNRNHVSFFSHLKTRWSLWAGTSHLAFHGASCIPRASSLASSLQLWVRQEDSRTLSYGAIVCNLAYITGSLIPSMLSVCCNWKHLCNVSVAFGAEICYSLQCKLRPNCRSSTVNTEEYSVNTIFWLFIWVLQNRKSVIKA